MPTMQRSYVIPRIANARSIYDADSIGVVWDPSPYVRYSPIIPFVASRFRVCALTIQACLRIRRMLRNKVRLLWGTPMSRLRSCVYVVISIARLRTTLPRLRARRRKLLGSLAIGRSSASLPKEHVLLTFKSYGHAIIFTHRLMHRLHERHLQCLPLETALGIISEALNMKLDRAVNSGKCKVVLEVFSSIASQLRVMRFVLDNLTVPLDIAAYKGLSACFYSLKELCRSLSVCKSYIQESPLDRSLASHKVFAKLENVHIFKFLLLDLCKCHHRLVVEADGFGSSMRNPIAQDFAWEYSPSCLPGSLMGHYLQLQAKVDLSLVLAELEEQPKSWRSLVDNWTTSLSAAEYRALRKLLHTRLMFPNAGRGVPEFLKEGMFVDNKYIRKVRHLGRGTYGVVEEVLCFGERYAMKTIKGLHSVEDANEAVVQAQLQHPNIVKLMWYTLNFDSDDSLSLLMDLMTTSLEDFIQQPAFDKHSRLLNYPLVALNIMMQIATAMRYLHSQGIMHRDLKAANVLVDGSWRPDPFNEGYINVKVADFGLAKVKRVGSQAAQANTWKVGTGYWRAPEVFWGESTVPWLVQSSSGSVGNRGSNNHILNYSLPADVYSFAMTCYEIVTGKKPFDSVEKGMKPRELKERIVKFGERPCLPDSLHPDLKGLIERCWDGRPEKRPSFKAICEELDQIRDDYALGPHL